MVIIASSAELITKTNAQKEVLLKTENIISANSFRELVKTKSDLHKILDNFYLKRFLIEETMSYDIYYACSYLKMNT